MCSHPLTAAEAAVQIALLNNRNLQAAYNELALAEADMVGQSSRRRIRPSRSRASPATAPAKSSVRSSATSWHLRHYRCEATSRATDSAKRSSEPRWRRCSSPPRFGAPTTGRWLRTRPRQCSTDAKATATSTAELARKLGETGALNKLDQAREQVYYAETTADLAAARQDATSSRERLARLMGLWGGDLDLPDPGQAAGAAPAAAEPAVHRGRCGRRIALDLQIARMEVDRARQSRST